MNRRLATLWLSAAFCIHAVGAPPRYDHIVIVVEENRTPTEIIGDRVNAPYINTLADGGVKFGSLFAEVHPSQPNYMHLFSGDHQGIVDDNLPPNFSTTPTATYPFRTPNMAAELIAAGFSFAAYSEELESAGTADWADYDPHSATNPGIYYRRKHVPWVNWVAKVAPIPANQLPPAINLCFTNFPTDYSTLPTVSFVIPNQLHDMHDGSRKQGDDWLRDHIDSYAQWAKTHNSLLIVTWDEDDYNSVNQIPTIFYGAGLRDGTTVGGTWTHHNILRTIEDMYGTAHAGGAAQVRPIIGPFTNDPPLTVRSFRQGASGYSSALDTHILAETPATTYGTNQELTADLDTSTAAGNQVAQVLMRFDSIIGFGLTQIPTNAIIHSAKLLIYTPLTPTGAADDYDSDDIFRIHRMLVNWNSSSTWNTLNGGVSTDDVEAASASTSSLMPDVESAPQIFDVTSDIELFRAGATNFGWVIRASSTGVGNGWTMRSSEAIDQTQRPLLEVVYTVSFTPYVSYMRGLGLTGPSAEPLADFDHDNLPNMAEYAYNTNPRVASDNKRLRPGGTSGTPAPYYIQEAGGVLEVEFLRRKTATDLTYHPQFSSDLVTWSDGLAPVVTPIDATWERVRVRDAAAGAPHKFVKVVLTLQ